LNTKSKTIARKRVSSASHAHVIRFVGSIDLGGYKWERREQSMRLRDQGSILDLVDQEGDYIVPRGGVILEACRGVTVKYAPHRGHISERCIPTLELANAVLCEDKEKNAAIDFVHKFGMPNGYHEIELQEFHRLAFRYDNALTARRSGSQSLTLSPMPRLTQYVNNGKACSVVRSFTGFCSLELMELVRLEREFKQCAFCNKWYRA
jgi:hypothetical protein